MLVRYKLTLGVAAIGVLACIAAFFFGRSTGVEAERSRYMTQQQIVQEAVDAMRAAAAEAISNIELDYATVAQELEREIRANAVYDDCVHDGSGLQLINDAILGAARRAGRRELPAPDPTE